MLWSAALAARVWAALWTSIGRVLFTSFLLSLAIIMALAVGGAVVGVLVANKADTWIIAIVCVVMLGFTIGGARWGNQYGGGFTGGAPVWVIALAGFFVPMLNDTGAFVEDDR